MEASRRATSTKRDNVKVNVNKVNVNKVNVNKVNVKLNDCRGRKAAAPLLLWRPTAATFVVAMNRVDVVELVVDLVDVDLDVDLVDVDLVDVDLDVDLVDVDLDVVPFC